MGRRRRRRGRRRRGSSRRRRRGLRFSGLRRRRRRRGSRRRRRRGGKQWSRRGKLQHSAAKRKSIFLFRQMQARRAAALRAMRTPKRLTQNALYLVKAQGVKGARKLSKARRRQLRRWIGRDYVRKIKRLSRTQLAAAVNNAGVWDPRKLSNSAQEALGLKRMRRNMLTGRMEYIQTKGVGRRPPLTGWQLIAKQKREMRVKVRSLRSDRKKFEFGLNRLKLLENLAARNASLEYRRTSMPESKRGTDRILQDASTYRKANWERLRLGDDTKLRRTKKLVGEHGKYDQGLRSEAGQFRFLSGRAFPEGARYHRFKDGTTYTGWHPNEVSAVLIPRAQYRDNIEVYRQLYRKTRGTVRRINRGHYKRSYGIK